MDRLAILAAAPITQWEDDFLSVDRESASVAERPQTRWSRFRKVAGKRWMVMTTNCARWRAMGEAPILGSSGLILADDERFYTAVKPLR